MDTMRRVIVTAERTVTVEEVPIPTLSPGEVRVRTVYSGVCGSDTHAQQGLHPNIKLPYAPGHEVVGVVDAGATDANSLVVGDRVTVEPTLPCWACKSCRSGRENLCENLKFFGCVWDQGGMADMFTIAANRVHRLPDDVDDLTAALIEPLATPVHAARLTGTLGGKTVAIIGAGTIGLLMLAVTRAAGAHRVVVSDILESKRARAAELGADAVINGASPRAAAEVRAALGESADVVFDCVAAQPTVLQGIDMALKGGTVVVVGVPSSAVTVPLPIVQDQQIRIQGSATYLPEDYTDAIELLRSGAVDISRIITAQYPLDAADQAFAASSSGDHIKVRVRP
jgi:2-desacetyl-2-hydroxyethyl bacteriochlorophyllide A dehydrogenase